MFEIETLPIQPGCTEVEGNFPVLDPRLLSPNNICTKDRLPYIKGIVMSQIRQNPHSLHKTLIPFIRQLHEDEDDDVRVAVMRLLPIVGEALHAMNRQGTDGIMQLVQCSAALLSDTSNYVREAALAAFDDLAGYLSPTAQERYLVPVIADLIGSDERLDRICGLLLLVSFIEKGIILGGETHLINWLSQLLCDDDHEVRQELASVYPYFLKGLPSKIVSNTALPHFKFLVKDKIWSVRKAAAEALHSLLEYVPVGPGSVDLQSMVMGYYASLSKDSSTFVKLAVETSVGELIVRLDTSLVSEELIDAFVGCVQETSDQPTTPMVSSCAEAFTDVAVKLGFHRWERLRTLFTSLSQSMEEDIHSALAAGLHRLAKILPSDAFRRDVLPFLATMMHGGSLTVRSLIAENFSTMLSSLPSELQELCLFHLQHLCQGDIVPVESQHSDKNSHVTFFTKGWRLRASLAQQLFPLASMLSADLVCEYILPLAFQLCEDSVAHVRIESSEQVIQVLASPLNETQTSIILAHLAKWQTSKNYKIRCVAALICQKAKGKTLSDKTMEQIEEIISKLKQDSVSDVRRLL